MEEFSSAPNRDGQLGVGALRYVAPRHARYMGVAITRVGAGPVVRWTATRRARVRLDLLDDDNRVIRSTAGPPGLAGTLRVRAATERGPHILRVTARGADGQVSSNELTVHLGGELPAELLDSSSCRRIAARRVDCRTPFEEFSTGDFDSVQQRAPISCALPVSSTRARMGPAAAGTRITRPTSDPRGGKRASPGCRARRNARTTPPPLRHRVAQPAGTRNRFALDLGVDSARSIVSGMTSASPSPSSGVSFRSSAATVASALVAARAPSAR